MACIQALPFHINIFGRPEVSRVQEMLAALEMSGLLGGRVASCWLETIALIEAVSA